MIENLYFSEPVWLWLLVPGVGWTVWLAMKSDASIQGGRLWAATTLRIILVTLLILALSGFEWRRKDDRMNVIYLVDRSLSVPPQEQENARVYSNESSRLKLPDDRAGVIVFGADAGIEMMPNTAFEWGKFQAIIDQESTELANAIRLATAAFPENGQKKLVVMTDGNADDAATREAVISARSQGVTIDVMPLGAGRPNDVLIEPLQLPGKLKKGQAFNIKSVVNSTVDQKATMRVYRNGEFLAQEPVTLEAGENAFSFQETLDDSGFYEYVVEIDAENDALLQNNKSFGQTHIQGDPTIVLVTENIVADNNLLAALEEAGIRVLVSQPGELFDGSRSLRFFDGMILSNIPAGKFSTAEMRQLESLVRDFGMGMVVIGGDNAFTAGSYRGTPLEDLLPLSMELDSKKVIPRGALALIMHGMEFANGNEVARQMAIGTLEALGPEDELGVLLWDGTERWLFPLEKTGNKGTMRSKIAGMNQGDLPHFQGLMELAFKGLQQSDANLKHVIVFSDGDPSPPSAVLMEKMREAKITVSAVLIAGHASDANMVFIADEGNGNFYNVTDPNDLPQVFLQETAIILKSAIVEDPFTPEIVGTGEPVRGITDLPNLFGYVSTMPKDRAAIPIVSPKGDPIFAYWNYGLGRVAAFTSDARTKWAADWINWSDYARFWQQTTQWALRKIENSDLDVQIIQEGQNAVLLIEAVDENGNFKNFLDLDGIALSPEGESVSFRINQMAPGQYRATIPMNRQGAYQFNIIEKEGTTVASTTMAGTSLSYSPEFRKSTTDTGLLSKMADLGGGIILKPDDPKLNPFKQGRQPTWSPSPMWDTLLTIAILLWLADVAIRRIDVDRAMILNAINRMTPSRKKSSKEEKSSHLAGLKKSVQDVKSRNTGQAADPGTPQTWVKPSDQPAVAQSTQNQSDKKKPEAPTPKAPGKKDKPSGESNLSSASRLLKARQKAKGDDSDKK